MLGATGLAERARVVMEKPFGSDLASARELNDALHDVLDEDHVFRIDHFLGKEATQNILAFRFANGLFEPAWNRDHIASVQIDVPEDLGLEGRGVVLRGDGRVSRHGRHPPDAAARLRRDGAAGAPRRALAARREGQGLRGDASRSIPPTPSSASSTGYRDEEDVDATSDVETFVALRVHVDTWRWAGVPFLLRTGKALETGAQTVTVGFREPPLRMFDPSADVGAIRTRSASTSPPTARSRSTCAPRSPGPSWSWGSHRWAIEQTPGADGDKLEAYERLLLDVMHGDHTLFTRADEIERLWELAQPLLDGPPKTQEYEQGSWGPQAALDLAGDAGWRVSRGA